MPYKGALGPKSTSESLCISPYEDELPTADQNLFPPIFWVERVF